MERRSEAVACWRAPRRRTCVNPDGGEVVETPTEMMRVVEVGGFFNKNNEDEAEMTTQ
jgi:hypothetical protein